VGIYSNNSITPDVRMGSDIIINIIFMLVVFWASEMVKTYKRKWAVVLALVGAVQIGRIHWLPLRYRELAQLQGRAFTYVCVTLALSGVFLLLGAAQSYLNSTILKIHMEQNDR
jgi:glucan phosphoethanolaminetransferase (alkaline phosphatase superfamily)